MNDCLHTIDGTTLNTIQNDDTQVAVNALESGKIIYLPQYAFEPKAHEMPLLSNTILDGKHKNISYDYRKQKLAGIAKTSELGDVMQEFMHRYAVFSRELVDKLLPEYRNHLIWGRTSYRPAQIKGRVSSKRKDDTRVHVDAFPSTPVNGHRILRVFCNVNPHGEPRVWHIGEPFHRVMQTFLSKIPLYNGLIARLLHLVRATKTRRSAYDHYMLHMHDMMKLNDDYQQAVEKQRIDFPAQTTWLVFTDQVSHAALSGQFLLEQTFYLPHTSMVESDTSPWSQLFSSGIVLG